MAILRRNYIGFVFQGFNLLGRTTALENVELPLIYRKVPKEQRNKLLKIYHPDENIDESICLKYSQKINEAYKVLKKKLKG